MRLKGKTAFCTASGAGIGLATVRAFAAEGARVIATDLNAKAVDSWVGATFVLLTGLGLFELARRQYVLEWGEIQTEIEKEIKRRETAV